MQSEHVATFFFVKLGGVRCVHHACVRLTVSYVQSKRWGQRSTIKRQLGWSSMAFIFPHPLDTLTTP
eukprot:3518200-Amphidinium_carterae.1